MYSDAILTRDVTQHGLRAGDVGTVVERHVDESGEDYIYPSELFAPRRLPAAVLRRLGGATRPRKSTARSGSRKRRVLKRV